MSGVRTPEVVTLGETMVGLTPADGGPLESALTFTRFIGGAESNVAIGAAKLGHSVGWVSRLGDDVFGTAILSELRAHHVDVSRVGISDSERTALYFKGRSTGAARTVVYYRKGSAMSRMTPEHLDGEYIASARLLHVTGITPALSAECLNTAERAMAIAKEGGATVTFDPNFRPQLWSRDDARRAFRRLIPYVDILIPGDDEAGLFLEHEPDVRDTHALLQALAALGVSAVYLKKGASGAAYWVNGETGEAPAVKVDVVDTVGAGDAFVAGVISGHVRGLGARATLCLANVMGALATTALGDTEGIRDAASVERMVADAYGVHVPSGVQDSEK